MGKTVVSIVLLIAVLSGCSSVISNSERFYEEHPRGRINWHEYMTDWFSPSIEFQIAGL
jgi:hypothetical protein